MKKVSLKEQIKSLKKELRKFKSQSLHDDLTGLFNHRKFIYDIKRNLAKRDRHNVEYKIVMLDIDNFKTVNDTLGHKAGDKKLQEVAKVLKNATRKVDKVYRLAGDEFIVKLYHCKDVRIFLKRIRHKFAEIDIKVSIGYSPLKEKILEVVDEKMYIEKRKNK